MAVCASQLLWFPQFCRARCVCGRTVRCCCWLVARADKAWLQAAVCASVVVSAVVPGGGTPARRRVLARDLLALASCCAGVARAGFTRLCGKAQSLSLMWGVSACRRSLLLTLSLITVPCRCSWRRAVPSCRDAVCMCWRRVPHTPRFCSCVRCRCACHACVAMCACLCCLCPLPALLLVRGCGFYLDPHECVCMSVCIGPWHC